MLSAEDLLAGSALSYEVAVPASVLNPADPDNDEGRAGRTVRLRPLTVQDLQVVSRAAKDSDSLVAVLMVQRSLIEPAMSVAQVSGMHAGMVQFLVREVMRISGIASSAEQVAEAADAPLAKAAFILAKEFGWTPEEVSGLTLGQVLLHLELLRQQRERQR